MNFLTLYRLGVRSLANASRARQFNPLNPPGVGWVPLPQTNMAAVVGRARSCVVGRARSVVRGHARSCVRGRSCLVVHGRARSVVRGRSCVRGRSFVVVRGRAWSCRSASFAASTAVLPERTASNNPLNPPGGGVGQIFLSY